MNSLTKPKSKILRFPERLADFKQLGWAYPLYAEIDLTSKCSLNCKGCHSKWLHRPVELDKDAIYSIIHQLKDCGCKAVVWSGGGDPLESSRWAYAMEMATAAGLKQGLYSHLQGINQNDVDFISKHCNFVYGHNTTADVKRPEGDCRWVCGWLVDASNFYSLKQFASVTNWKLFDVMDVRPLITEKDDYGWVSSAIEFMRDFHNPAQFDEEGNATFPRRFTWAEYKFQDLQNRHKGRGYGVCYSTDFVACIGSDGTMWECVNRRGITSLGNIVKDGLVKIWQLKESSRCDMSQCRELCRNHELNKTLWEVFGPALEDEEFV